MLKHLQLIIQGAILLLTAAALFFALDVRLARIEEQTKDLPQIRRDVQDVGQRLARVEGAQPFIRPEPPSSAN
jgi:hypothetical protein